MSELVECLAGYTYPVRPVSFVLGGARRQVAAIVAEWRTPTGKHYRVQAEDGIFVELIYGEEADEWTIRQC